MRTTKLLVRFGLLVGLVLGISHEGALATKKVTVCHRPPGNPANAHTISVAEASTEAHLKHGDQLGECPSGCQANGAICDDGDACTSDTCLPDGECQHTSVNCDDGNPCTTNACLSATGCVSFPSNGGACDDGNDCTSGDACLESECVGNAVPGCCSSNNQCDDHDSCTADTCSGSACQNLAVDCSVADKCLAGFCDPDSGLCSTTPVDCSDSNVCTDDFCDPTIGCYSQPTSTPPEVTEVSCRDGADNDCDGLVDFQDPDCPTYFYSCGDPVCAGWTSKNIPLCTTQQAGDPCSIVGESCDPKDPCNRILICSNVDPTQAGCPL